jgi:hypothetical protein
LKSKIILSGLFLTGAVSCASFRPFILTDAYINPQTTTNNVTYEQLNFSYALFNQYASGLTYDFRLDFSAAGFDQINRSIAFFGFGPTIFFNDWDTITAVRAEAFNVSGVYKNMLNEILFDRAFDRVTKQPLTNKFLNLVKFPQVNSVNLEITIRSKISYNVNIGSVYKSDLSATNGGIDQHFTFISFFNSRDEKLQDVLLDTDMSGVARSRLYNLSTIVTNVKRFDLKYQWVDTPPFITAVSQVVIYEFNLFTQNQEISIPDDASGDRFGFEFVAVEWWNILGHLQNFIWWIINQSPIAPVFEWIEDYVITWVSGLITFITGVFRL